MKGFLQLLVAGVAQGCIYALIALGFTVVYRATRVINFAQGAMLLAGAYLISWQAVDEKLPFAIAVLVATAALALLSATFQIAVLRRLAVQNLFTTVMITLGLSIATTGLIDAIFGGAQRQLGDPWGSSTLRVAGLSIEWIQVWAVICTFVVLSGFFAFDRWSRYGLALRATAADPEAAAAVGVPVRRVHALTWAIAGIVAVLGGLFLSGFPNQPNPSLGDSALIAFPAVILGGLDSPKGTVVGGLTIGIVTVMTSGYAPAWLGTNFYQVAPYVLMIPLLLVRPYGLFGSRPVERL